MSFKLFKRHAFFGAFTLVGFFMLFMVGLAVSFSVDGYAVVNPELKNYTNKFLWWRVTAYVLLVVFWPGLIKRAAIVFGAAKEAPESRKTLIFLILLYELVIVQNPLSFVLKQVL